MADTAFCSNCELFNLYEDRATRTPSVLGGDGEPAEVGFCRLKSEGVWRDALCDRYVSAQEPSVEVVFLRKRVAELEEKLATVKGAVAA
jgi:hypothetical protein